MIADPKWTPARRAALRRTIEAARRFVRAADEFVPEDGANFYPDALGEHSDALSDALGAEGRAWDEGPAPLPLNLRPEPLCPVDGFAAPPGNPGARVIRTG
jgi:hypothetical protein